MNIIELFEKLGLNNNKVVQFSQEEIIRIEKQVNVEKKINPDVDVNVAENLIDALKKYPQEFNFIINHRNLYNFFANTNYYQDKFNAQEIVIDDDKIKKFIGNYLEEELTLFFDKYILNNQYNQVNDLLSNKKYFPEDLLYNLEKKANAKVEYVLRTLENEQSGYSSILYIKYPVFYEFLSHFASLEMDQNINVLLSYIVDIYNIDKKSEFAGSTMIAMNNFNAFDEELIDVLSKNSKIVRDNKSGSNVGGSGFSWRTFGIILFVLIKLAFFTNKCSSNSSSNSIDTFNYNNGNQSEINKVRINLFLNYLVISSVSDLSKIDLNTSIKTGENPFENIFVTNNDQKEFKKNVNLKNESNYDLILIIKSFLNGKEGYPEEAIFIKKGESTSIESSGSYHFYFGNELAKFITSDKDSNTNYNGIFKENRFLIQPNNNLDIIKKEFIVQKDVIVTQKGSRIIIKSPFLYCSNDSIKTSVDEYEFK